MPEISESGAYIRSLGGLTFTVTISEAEKQTAKMTDYPVEDGASYSDHVILAPREVTVQVGQGVDEAEKQTAKMTDYPVEDGVNYSDHVILAPREVTVQVGQGVDDAESDPRDKLDKLRELMTKREPIELYTGKSYYKSMIITAISTTTDAKTETVMIASVTLREVRIAQTQAAAVPVISKKRQKQPKKTVASTKRGTQQVQTVSTPQQPNPQAVSGLAGLFGARFDNSGGSARPIR